MPRSGAGERRGSSPLGSTATPQGGAACRLDSTDRSGGGAGPALDAIILAGGRAARLGGADKPGLVVGPESMAAMVARAAAAAGARRVIVVGPQRPDLDQLPVPDGLAVVREDPPGSGPVPALRAGLPRARAPWVALLAADLPFLRARHVGMVRDGAVSAGRAGALLADDTGRPQWLTGCWATAGLRAALAGYDGASLRGLLAPLDPVLISYQPEPGEPPPWLDCDTPAQLAAARAWPGIR